VSERRLPFLCFLHTLNRSGAKNSINQFLHLSGADGNFIYVCRRSSAEEIKSSLSTREIEGGKFSSLLWRRARRPDCLLTRVSENGTNSKLSPLFPLAVREIDCPLSNTPRRQTMGRPTAYSMSERTDLIKISR